MSDDEMCLPQRRLMPNAATVPEPVVEYRTLLGEIIHQKIMQTARTEDRKPLLDERLEYAGYHGCLSICRVRIFDPTPKGKEARRPCIVVFTEMPDNPGTSITNRVEHLANLLYIRLGKPEPIPVFVEHYPSRGAHYEKRNQWQYVKTERFSVCESFSFVGFRRNVEGRFQTPHWQYTTRMTVEVIAGQPIGD